MLSRLLEVHQKPKLTIEFLPQPKVHCPSWVMASPLHFSKYKDSQIFIYIYIHFIMHYIQQVVGNSERPSMQTMWSIDGRSMEQNHAKREAFPPVNSSISQGYERIENLIRSQITRNSISEANDYKLLQSEQLHCYFFGKENTDPWRFNVKTSVEAPKLAPKPTFEAIQVTHRLISSYAPVGSGGSRWSCEITVPQYIQWWSITIFYSYTSGIFSSEHVTNIWIKHLMKTRWNIQHNDGTPKSKYSLTPYQLLHPPPAAIHPEPPLAAL